MGEREGKRKEIERLLKLKEEGAGGKEALSRLLGEAPRQVPPPPAAPKRTFEEAKPAPVLHAEVKGRVEKVLDRYGAAEILKLEGESLPLYRLRIPDLTEKERELLAACKKKAVEEIKVDPEGITDPSERRRIFMQELMKILEREGKGMRLPPARLRELSELAFHDMIGYGPLDYLISDDRLEDILVIGVNKPVYVYHSRYGMCSTNIVFEEEDTIRYYIDKMARLVGRRIDHQMPLLDARLPDGSRINATIPPVSLEGPTLSIRKFRKDPLTVVDLMNLGTLSPEVGAFLWLLVHGLDVKPANILFSGGTGSGKTTLLNSATTFVPEHERIISIEDTAELQLPHPHWVRLETRPPNIEGRGEITMDDLVKNALRMRPDRIVVGEVRGPEARTMFTAMNTGHDGALFDTSVIQLSDGRYRLIGEVCEELFRKYAGRERRYRDLEFIELEEGDRFRVVSVDGRLKAGAHTVTRVWRRRVRRGERMVRILTRSGHEVVLTKTHPLFTIAGGEVLRKEAGSLKPGEFVACLLSPPVEEREPRVDPELLRGLSRYLLLPEEGGEIVLFGRRYRKVENNGGRELERAEFMWNPHGHPLRVPATVSPELAYLAGVVCGDGCLSPDGYCTSVTFDDEEYLGEFVRCARSYLPGYDFRVRREGESSCRLDLGSRLFSGMLERVFGIPRGKKAAGWTVPDLVMLQGRTLSSYLAGLFDAGGSVDAGTPSIMLATESEEGARKVWYGLQRLGIPAAVRKHENGGRGKGVLYRVVVSGVENLERFLKKVPLHHGRKRRELERAVGGQRPCRGTCAERVPEVGGSLRRLREALGLSVAELSRRASRRGRVSEGLIRRLERGRIREVGRGALRAMASVLLEEARRRGDAGAAEAACKLWLLASSDVYWDKVEGVEEVELEGGTVYDLTVDEDHNYVAGGMLVSNCMGTLHANSAAETITRLTEAPMSVPPIMIPALDVVVMLQRIYHRQKGHIRRITEIAEVTGLEGGKPQLSRIFKWNPRTDKVEPTGVPLKFRQVLSELSGRSGTEIEAELKRRAAVLEWMRSKGIRNVFEVGRVIQEYYQDPEGVLRRVKGG